MSNGGRIKLPDNPKIKDINMFKKHLNWGELPAFYHMVASSVGELEGILSHGFDNALMRLVKPANWNLKLLGGREMPDGSIMCDKKPRLSIIQVMTERGFEVHAFPIIQGKRIDQYINEHRLLEYKTWDPVTMRRILRINQLHKYIEYYFKNGDDADLALIKYASRLVDGVILYLQKHVDVVDVDGVTIKQFYEKIKSDAEKAQLDDLLFLNQDQNKL